MSWVIVGSAAVGLAKSELIDKPKHEKMQAAEAEKTKWSPWTGMQGKTLEAPSSFGSMMQGAATGAMLKQGGAFDGGGNPQAPSGTNMMAMNDPSTSNQSIYQNMFDMNRNPSAIG